VPRREKAADRIIASAEARGRCAVPMTPQEGRRLINTSQAKTNSYAPIPEPSPGGEDGRGSRDTNSSGMYMRTLSDQGTKWVCRHVSRSRVWARGSRR